MSEPLRTGFDPEEMPYGDERMFQPVVSTLVTVPLAFGLVVGALLGALLAYGVAVSVYAAVVLLVLNGMAVKRTRKRIEEEDGAVLSDE